MLSFPGGLFGSNLLLPKAKLIVRLKIVTINILIGKFTRFQK